MINLITQISKYIIVILSALYAMKCFTVFRAKHEVNRGSVYVTQNILMFMIHFICYLIIYMNVPEVKVIAFYLVQVILLIVTIVLHSIIYKRASRLLVNNMCFLLMVGFVILTRLDFDLAARQFGIAVAAIILALFIPIIIAKVKVLEKWGIFYGILGILVIASVFVFGKSINGAINWVQIGGVSLQPSELAKVIFVFFIAAMLQEKPSFKRIVVVSAAAAGFVLLLAAQNDLGAAVIFFMVYLFMLYVATEEFRYMILGMVGLSGAAVIAYNFFSHVRVRVTVWLNPWSDYSDRGYQIAQSLFAIGTGSWFGVGLYQGMPSTIPIVVSDFIFSAISEEMGAIFCVCLLLVYVSCFVMFINISLQLSNPFYKLLSIGLSVSYAFQIFLCVGGVIKLIPHTGVTLPLISNGGSSILSTIIIFAVIQGLYLLKQKEVQTDEKTGQK